MDLGLKGMNALVTGSTKGIGRAIVDTLVAEGCNVAICSRTQADVDAAVAELSAQGVKAVGSAVDALDRDSLQNWVKSSGEALGGIDILVSNVSGGNGKSEEDWKNNFEGDLMGAVRMVEAATPMLEASGKGSIIMISTTAAIEAFIGANSYNAIKAGLLNYSGALSQELAPKNIRVNAVSPGPIMIEGGAWDQIKQHMTPFYESTLSQIPMGRMGTAQEVANQVVMLASPAAGFTTGTNVVIDGGITKRIQF